MDAWITLQAAVVAIATSCTALALVVRLKSDCHSASLVCPVALAAIPVGIGLWCTNLLALLATVHSREIEALAGLASLPIAGLGTAGAFWIAVTGNSQAWRSAAAGATLAATVCTLYVASAGELYMSAPVSFEHVGRAFAGTTLACALALLVKFAMRERRSIRASLVSFAAALIGGAGIMLVQADSVVYGSSVPLWHQSSIVSKSAEAVAVAITAGALAILAIAYVLIACEGRLAARVRRHAREIEEVRTRLEHLATHDALTGLPNRTRFKEILAQAVADTERPGRTVAMAVLDLDRFSTLNHSLGYGTGDSLLAEVGRRLASLVPSRYFLARLGSDEFVVLIDSVAAKLEAEMLLSRIIAILQEPIWFHGSQVYVHPSIGVSVWPDHGRRIDDLLAQAEAALSQAKQLGGNSIQFFRKGMNDSMQERLALENDLRRALTANEFELWFQPELSAKSGRIVAAEALLRWRHPTRGLIDPSLFVPLAEATGLMIPLGDWILREACRHVRTWRNNGLAPIRLAVNLSATQFRHSSLVEVIQSALHAEELDASCLEVELTESAVMINPEDSIATLKQLRRMGITVAIDDFGTGYSSLSYLRHFRIDKLKIDRSFLRDLTRNGTDKSIVRAIVELAHSVGLHVVAEGVETDEQLQSVRDLGCDMWQGFYCCEPQTAGVFADMLGAEAGSRTALVAALRRLRLPSDS